MFYIFYFGSNSFGKVLSIFSIVYPHLEGFSTSTGKDDAVSVDQRALEHDLAQS